MLTWRVVMVRIFLDCEIEIANPIKHSGIPGINRGNGKDLTDSIDSLEGILGDATE
jgi:hypothetical protein